MPELRRFRLTRGPRAATVAAGVLGRRRRRGLPRARLLTGSAVLAVVSVTASGLTVPPAQAATTSGTGARGASKPPAVQQDRPAPTKRLAAKPRPAPAWPVTRPAPAVAWPAVSDTELTVPGAAAAAPASGLSAASRAAASSVAAGPVSLAPVGTGVAASAAATGGSRKVRVRVLPRSAGRTVGVDGLLVGLSTTTGAPGATQVRVDARAMASTAGGDWASRARLVELSGCTVTGTGTAQTVTGCAGRRMLPTSTSGDGVLTATVTPVAQTPGPTTASSAAAETVFAAASGTGVTVLAAAAAASGPSGSYAATPLSAASSWSAGGQNGDFSWSYPFTLPPVPGALTPTVSVGYDSAAVDGRVATSNNQPSIVGDGFDLSGGGFIERRYVSCSDDMANGNNATATGDLCWKTDNATLSMGPRSGPLVKTSTANVWRSYGDDGSKLTHVGTTGAAGEHWTLTTTDGTVYTFGKGTAAVTGAATNSAWSVPVFGNQSGEPGFKAGNFAGSAVSQVWRWNLDSVVDVHGNAINYFYAPESNRYGQNGNKTVAAYTRGGYVSRIDYGLRSDAATTPAVARVVFTTAERCLPSGSITCAPAQLTSANAKSWPDVPFDQLCSAATGSVANPATGGCPNAISPTFFSRIRLTGVTTQISTSATAASYRDVDRFGITHTFLDPGDGTSKVLWPSAITRTGVAADGTTTLAAPTTKLQPTTQLPNRVDAIGDGAPAINRFRLSWVDNGVGGTVTVSYANAECTAANKPADPASNTRRCFPVFYTKPGATSPTLNWFHKYVVAAVASTDAVGGQPDAATYYQYVGGAKWRFDRDDLTPAKYRTWGQFRGFATVRAFNGGPAGPWTASESLFLRGMDGDCANAACSAKTSVTVTDSRKGTIVDSDRLNGFTRESITYDGAKLTLSGMTVTAATLGKVVNETLNTPVLSGVHADDGVRKAQILRAGTVSNRTYRADGTTFIQSDATTTFDDNGMATSVDDAGDTSTTADDACTTTRYAADTAHWILDAVTETRTVAKNCATTPSLPADLLSATRTLYDGATTWSASPTLSKGEATGTLTASGWDSGAGALTFVRTATMVYDALGRMVDSADALGRHTKTAYTPAGAGPVTSATVTNPAGHTATTTMEPGRGLATAVTDANGNTTTTKYDALGRVVGVWLPGRALTASATKTFSYTFANTATTPATPTLIASGDLRNDGTYTSGYAYFDGLLRPIQSQSIAADGSGQRIVTSTGYDGRGLPVSTLGPTLATGAAGSGAVTIPDANLAARTDLVYDGIGRVTSSELRAGTGSANWRKYTTSTAYDGLATTVTPPAGGTITSTTVDVRGRTTLHRQYTSASGTAGASQDTTYLWRPDGLLNAMTDPAGIRWKRTYDLRGRLTGSDDPDHGTTFTNYDDAGQVTSVTDARGITLAYTYDALGRRTEERSGSATGTLLASWTYDTVAGGKGQPASSTRYDKGNAYTRSVTGYDSWYHVTGTRLSIPATETGQAGIYTTTTTYNLDGQPSQYLAPKKTGILGDGLTFGYNGLGLPRSLTSSSSAPVQGTTYSAYGEPLRLAMGNAPLKPIYLTYGYAEGTRRLATRTVNAGNANPLNIDVTSYTWDDAGNLKQITDKPTDPAAGYTADTQCFSYDALRHLTSAWTPASNNCATAPAVNALGGPAPYWLDWTVDNASGNRTSQTSHATAGNTVTKYAYPATTAARPHSLTSTTTTGPAGAGGSISFGYDAAGNTTSRAPAGGGTTTYAWDEAGRLAGASTPGGSTSQVYDADGNLLITRDAKGSTLYAAPGTEIRWTNNGTGSITTLDYKVRNTYTFLGQTVGVRESIAVTGGATSSTVMFTFPDPHNTGELAVDSVTLAPTFRRTTPYGELRGAVPASWPGTRGFVGGIQDTTTGLTQLGARPYDPGLGRFLSVDPVLDLSDPQQWNPYVYSGNNPTTWSDPTGLCSVKDAAAQDALCAGNTGSQWSPGSTTVAAPNFQAGSGSVYAMTAHTRPSGRTTTAPSAAAVQAQARADQARARMIEIGKEALKGIAEITGLKSAYDCVASGDLVGCFETVAQLASSAFAGVGLGAMIWRAATHFRVVAKVARLIEKGIGALKEWRAAKRAAEAMETACFVAGTQVLMADGTQKAIEDVKVGDKVASQNVTTGKDETRTVTRTYVHHEIALYDVTVDQDKVTTTANHPFYVEGRGWTIVKDLRPGDRLRQDDGSTVAVRAVAAAGRTATVYNFEVESTHDYYVRVGTHWVLVHNDCGEVFVRRGTSWESTGRLGRQAQAAEDTGRFGHGVSVTSPESNLRLSSNPEDAVAATRAEIEEAGFELRSTPTRADPDHHTLLLPKPVTSDVARTFNELFGRTR